MAETDFQVTEADIASVLTQKVNIITNLEIRVATLVRAVTELQAKVDELGQTMPKVGKKKFSYSAKGQAAAKKYAKKSGMKVRRKTKKKSAYQNEV